MKIFGTIIILITLTLCSPLFTGCSQEDEMKHTHGVSLVIDSRKDC